mmetsp:Transcript_13084/g.31107  ORF Transcript_13084/g.31107 Transcript_13084/m.31107 type:complete len:376 (+) Transcript_13084:788-1915(+)
MHELVVNIIGAGVVRHRCESSEAIFINKRLQRVKGGHGHICAHVPLEIAQKERITDVLLDNCKLTVVDSTHIVDNLNSSAATAAGRLHDPHVRNLDSRRRAAALQIPVLLSDLGEALNEQAILFRKYEGLRTDVEVLTQLSTCSRVPVDASLQKVLARQVLVLGKVIDLLPDTQARVVQLWFAPCPAQVPCVGETQSMGEFLPTVLPVEDASHNVVNLRAVLHDLVVTQRVNISLHWQWSRHGARISIHLVDNALQEDTVEPCTTRGHCIQGLVCRIGRRVIRRAKFRGKLHFQGTNDVTELREQLQGLSKIAIPLWHHLLGSSPAKDVGEVLEYFMVLPDCTRLDQLWVKSNVLKFVAPACDTLRRMCSERVVR